MTVDLVAFYRGQMRTLNESDLSSNELGTIGDILKRHFDAPPKKMPQFDKTHAAELARLRVFGHKGARHVNRRRDELWALNDRLGFAKATDAFNAGHGAEYLLLMNRWDIEDGKQTADEPGKGNAAEHSVPAPLRHEVQPESGGMDTGESERRGISGSIRDAGDGRLRHDLPSYPAHGGGDGDGGSVPSAPSSNEAPGSD